MDPERDRRVGVAEPGRAVHTAQVAEPMAALGAESRFLAGVRAHELGLVQGEKTTPRPPSLMPCHGREVMPCRKAGDITVNVFPLSAS